MKQESELVAVPTQETIPLFRLRQYELQGINVDGWGWMAGPMILFILLHLTKVEWVKINLYSSPFIQHLLQVGAIDIDNCLQI